MDDRRKLAQTIEPTIRLGKTGLSEGQITEIKKQLEKRKIVKIKMLRSFVLTVDTRHEIDEVSQIVAGLANADVILAVGNTFTIGRKRK